MPRKIRELLTELKRAGFILDRQRGSHRQFKHALFQGIITLSGAEGEDVKAYQERQIAKAIAETKSVE